MEGPPDRALGKTSGAFCSQFMTAAKSSRSDVLTFLGLLAGAYEDELLPGKDNLTPEALQNL